MAQVQNLNISTLVGGYVVVPKFQRNVVWSKSQKQQLIQSLLEGIIPHTMIVVVRNGKNLLIDGLQRFTAIQEFIQGNFPVELEVGGKLQTFTYKNLPEELRNKLLYQTTIPVIVYQYDELPISLYELFVLYNKNTKPLSQGELLRAIAGNDKLIELIDDYTKFIQGKGGNKRGKGFSLIVRSLTNYFMLKEQLQKEQEKIQKLIEVGDTKKLEMIIKGLFKLEFKKFFDYLVEGVDLINKKLEQGTITFETLENIITGLIEIVRVDGQELVNLLWKKPYMYDVMSAWNYAQLELGIKLPPTKIEELINELTMVSQDDIVNAYKKVSNRKGTTYVEKIIAQLINKNVQKPNIMKTIITNALLMWIETAINNAQPQGETETTDAQPTEEKENK